MLHTRFWRVVPGRFHGWHVSTTLFDPFSPISALLSFFLSNTKSVSFRPPSHRLVPSFYVCSSAAAAAAAAAVRVNDRFTKSILPSRYSFVYRRIQYQHLAPALSDWISTYWNSFNFFFLIFFFFFEMMISNQIRSIRFQRNNFNIWTGTHSYSWTQSSGIRERESRVLQISGLRATIPFQIQLEGTKEAQNHSENRFETLVTLNYRRPILFRDGDRYSTLLFQHSFIHFYLDFALCHQFINGFDWIIM